MHPVHPSVRRSSNEEPADRVRPAKRAQRNLSARPVNIDALLATRTIVDVDAGIYRLPHSVRIRMRSRIETNHARRID